MQILNLKSFCPWPYAWGKRKELTECWHNCSQIKRNYYWSCQDLRTHASEKTAFLSNFKIILEKRKQRIKMHGFSQFFPLKIGIEFDLQYFELCQFHSFLCWLGPICIYNDTCSMQNLIERYYSSMGLGSVYLFSFFVTYLI